MQASCNIRLDAELKETAFGVFDNYGLSPAQAIRLFLKQVAYNQSNTFTIGLGTVERT